MKDSRVFQNSGDQGTSWIGVDMKGAKRVARTLLLGSLFLPALNAQAEEVTTSFWEDVLIASSAGVTLKNISLDKDFGTNSKFGAGSVDTNFTALNLGITFVYDRYFLGFVSDIPVITGEETNSVPFAGPVAELERVDHSLLAGYAYSNEITLFAGWKYGGTELTPSPFLFTDDDGASPCDQDGECNLAMTNSSPYVQKYNEQGFYLGGNYQLQVLEASSVTFSAAYAFMQGEYKDNCSVNGDDCAFDFDGPARGVSLGARYTQPLQENMVAFVDFKYQSYLFEGDDKTGKSSLDVREEVRVDPSVEVEEKVMSLGAGINYVF